MNKANIRFSLLALFGGLLAALCLVPGLDGGFIFDDRVNIEQNAALHVARLGGEDMLYAIYSFQPGSGSRALSMFTFAVDFWRGGLDASVFKSTNLLIHVLTTMVLAVFFRRLLMVSQVQQRHAIAGGLALALLWALHPLQVSSVLYVVQRMQTLVTLFMVLALWAYLCMRQAQIEGRRSRQYGVLAALFWVLGYACKEDAALLPAYALALELTVLRFAAASPRLGRAWCKGYLFMVLVGAVAYVLVVVPHYWHWDAYVGREFSSYERLLSQGRVLVMYIGQILLPIPSSMPFYYDDFVISRGWLQPPATLAAWMLVLVLLVWAWGWRVRRPLFALGVLTFFFGHFMTSNVINLELAFEHRNHFPLVGAVLAIADLLWMLAARLHVRALRGGVVFVMMVLLVEGVMTAQRAYMWGEPMRFAAETLRLAPRSERAWMALNAVTVDRSGFKAGSPWLDRAISICEAGARVTGSATLRANAVIYKTIRGDVVRADWDGLLARLPHVPMNPQNKGIAYNMLNNVERGMALDGEGVVRTWEVIGERAQFSPDEYLRMGTYIHNETREPDRAFPFLRKAVELSPSNDPAIAKLMADLESVGRHKWLKELREVQVQVAEQAEGGY